MSRPPLAIIFLILFSVLSRIDLIDSINPINQERFEQNAVIERFERFERLFPLVNLINLINRINEEGLINSINSVNPFNQSLAWSQNTEKQPTSDRVQLPKNYIIGQADVLEIFVWRNEQLSRQVVVRPDGKISLPLLQDIQAEGFTVLELKEDITSRFKQYVNNPTVTVIVNEINSYKVSVLGRVVRPGVYPITGDTTIVEAISMAGGFTEWANKRKITLIRDEGGKKKNYRINYKKIESGLDPRHNVILHRGDTIIVP